MEKDFSPSQNERLQVKRSNDESDDGGDESEDDEHFGGGTLNPGSDSGTSEPKGAPPP